MIVDDERAARSRLRKMLAPFSRFEIVGEAQNGLEAVEQIASHTPDVVFMDVQMPALNGFEVLRTLSDLGRQPLIIFATAHDQYALEAFESNAIAYLLKPINRDRLARALERVEKLLSDPNHVTQELGRLRALEESTRQPLHHVVGRVLDRLLLVPIEEVCFFRVEDGVVRMKTASASYRTSYNLTDLEPRLPNPPFFRAHRAVIANLRMVGEISPMFNGSYVLVMKDEQRSEVIVSERRAKIVREILQ
jgi:DNA-binding LytR/AlgR family response regulator